MGAGVGSATVAQDYHCGCVGVLRLKMFIPNSFDVITDKLGSVVTRTYSHISNIISHIVDSVRDNLTVGERAEVVVKRLGPSLAYYFAFPLEVANEFLLLGVDADDRNTNRGGLLSDICNVQKLGVPVLNILHREVLDERPVTEPHLFKHLPDNIFGYITSLLGHFPGNLRRTHRHPNDIFVLRQACCTRSDDQFERIESLRMSIQFPLSPSSGTADTPGFRRIAGMDFIDGLVDCLFACTEKLCNFVHAMPAKGKSLGSEILSLLVFVEQGHKQLLLGCEHFWRSVRNHLKYLGIVFKVTNYSPVLQIYLTNNQIFNYSFRTHFEVYPEPLDDDAIGYQNELYKIHKLYYVIF